MNQLFKIVGLILLLSGCKLLLKQEDLIVKSKIVRMQAQAPASYVRPSFKQRLDSASTMSFLVRSRVEPVSAIVANGLVHKDPAVFDLENNLVRNHFEVIDRALYYDRKLANKNYNYPFDYIIEIINIETTKHYTGIVFRNENEYYLEGKIVTVKIIDVKKGITVALITAEYLPCVNGCKIKYDQYKVIELSDLSRSEFIQLNGDSLKLKSLKEGDLMGEISDFIRMKLNKTRP